MPLHAASPQPDNEFLDLTHERFAVLHLLVNRGNPRTDNDAVEILKTYGITDPSRLVALLNDRGLTSDDRPDSGIQISEFGQAIHDRLLQFYAEVFRDSINMTITGLTNISRPVSLRQSTCTHAGLSGKDKKVRNISLSRDEIRILTLLRMKTLIGRELRQLLDGENVSYTSGTFSRTMQRLCKLNLVQAEEVERAQNGGHRQKQYSLTELGRDEWNEAMAFYARLVELSSESGLPLTQRPLAEGQA